MPQEGEGKNQLTGTHLKHKEVVELYERRHMGTRPFFIISCIIRYFIIKEVIACK